MSARASTITDVTMFTQPFVQAQIKENIIAPRHWLCEGNSPVTDEFPAQRASNADNISIWWRHHALFCNAAAPGYSVMHADVIFKLDKGFRHCKQYLKKQKLLV